MKMNVEFSRLPLFLSLDEGFDQKENYIRCDSGENDFSAHPWSLKFPHPSLLFEKRK